MTGYSQHLSAAIAIGSGGPFGAEGPINELWWPAIGGIGLGIIGFFVPRVLGTGYSTLSDILNNQLSLQILVSVLIFKALALFISLGSRTSGGLLAPMLICGSALGAIFATIVNRLVPGAHLDPSAYALVAMAAMFGAASRATFAFIVFAFEITRDYNAILPLMLVGVIADGVAIVFMRNSIMTEKLARRGLRVHQDYETDVMQQVTVGEVMAQDMPTIPSTMRISDLAERIARNDSSLAEHQALPILDEQGQLVGIITRGDVLRALDDDANGDRSVLEVGSDHLIIAYPDEPVNTALDRMLQYNIGRLPVVSRTDSHHMVGYLGRSGVLQARLHRHQEEAVREPGWLTRFAQSTKSS